MSWIALLGIAVVVVALAALTGIKPSGTKPVASTRLMSVARVVLFGIAVILLLVAAGNFFGG